MELKVIKMEEYHDFIVSKRDVSLQMRWDYSNVLKMRGWKITSVGLYENNEIVGAALLCGKPLRFGGMNYICQYGPYIDFTNQEHVTFFFQEVKTILKDLGATVFQFNPNLVWKRLSQDGEVEEDYSYQALDSIKELGYCKQNINLNTNGSWNIRFHYMKDLTTLTEQTLLKSYRSQGKRSVKKGLNNGIIITEATGDEILELNNLLNMSAEKHGFSIGLTKQYYDGIKDFLKDDVHFWIAKLDVLEYIKDNTKKLEAVDKQIKEVADKDNQKKEQELSNRKKSLIDNIRLFDGEERESIIISGGVFIQNYNELIYLFGGNDSNYKKLCSSFVLQDYAMRYALENGISTYNMYGIDGLFDGSDSVYNFKYNFGGYINEYIGTYEIIIDEKNYRKTQIINKIKKILKR